MANINTYIEQAIRNIESERDQQIAIIKDAVMQEKVAPKNAEIDALCDKAVQEKQDKLNRDILALQEAFEKEKQDMINASERQKTNNANTLINAETASITAEYNAKLAELRKIIGA